MTQAIVIVTLRSHDGDEAAQTVEAQAALVR